MRDDKIIPILFLIALFGLGFSCAQTTGTIAGKTIGDLIQRVLR